VLAARAYGLGVLDGVHLDLDDDAGLRFACEQGRGLGFDGKTLIHPRQIAAANEAFAPSPDEVIAARELLAAWRQARAAGRGVVVVNGRLVEHLHVQEAERLLAIADAIAASAGGA
jgi:citrate lyase subunit beta/citryl-CoA lyase